MAEDRRVVRTKVALTAALFDLLAEKDFDKISITELARRADVDRKTFYLHYQNVDEILEEFYEERVRDLWNGMDQAGMLQGDNLDIVGFFRMLCGQVTENLSLFRHLAQGGGYTYYIERIRAILCATVEDYYRARGGQSKEKLKFLSEFYAAAVMRAYLIWLKGELDMDATTLAEIVGKAVSGGLPLSEREESKP